MLTLLPENGGNHGIAATLAATTWCREDGDEMVFNRESIVVSSDLRALPLTFDRFFCCSANVQARQTILPKSFSCWLLCLSFQISF